MGLIDLILFPLYILFFSLVFSARRRRIEDPVLKKYQLYGFWIKVCSTIAFIIYSVLLKGDSMSLYYPEGINMAKLIIKDVSNINLLFMPGKEFDENLLADSFNRGYFSSESNYFIARMVTVLSFITFGSYSCITLIFSMISFSGVWRLYKFFYEQYPHLHKKLAIAIIYLPTFVFWSSGILKDPICTGMMGWLTYALYNVMIKKQGLIKNSLVVIISSVILGTIKLYILVSYLPFLLLFIVLHYVLVAKHFVTKALIFVAIVIIGTFFIYILTDKLKEEMGGLALDKLTESVKTTQDNFLNISDQAESSFSLGVTFDGSTSSLVKIAPAAITATLFRPYLWESKKISTLLSSMESLVLMLFTIYVFFKAGPFRFVASIIKDPMILYCFCFSILFALFVGATTLNFGTLVRYKIPCMPFYIIALVLIAERIKPKKTEPATEITIVPEPV